MTSTEDTAVRAEIRQLVGDVPEQVPMTGHRSDQWRRHLESEVSAAPPLRRHRRLAVVSTTAGVAVLLAAGSTVVYRVAAPATDTSYAKCFTAPSLDSLGTTVSEASTSTDPGPRAVDAVDACSAIWQAGLLELGAPGSVDRATLATDAPVPDLVACRLENGAAGVFPGTAQTCFELGLPQLATG